jgi:hypothetical protein
MLCRNVLSRWLCHGIAIQVLPAVYDPSAIVTPFTVADAVSVVLVGTVNAVNSAYDITQVSKVDELAVSIKDKAMAHRVVEIMESCVEMHVQRGVGVYVESRGVGKL